MPSATKLASEISRAMADLLKQTQAELAKPTANWSHGVTWVSENQRIGNEFVGEVGTNDAIYGWQNDGTAPHPIVGAPVLAFRLGKGVKTAGYKSIARGGSGLVVTPSVNHPGTLAQDWTGQALTAIQPRIAGIFSELEIYE